MEDLKADVTLDAKELSYPMPIIQTKKKIEMLQSGQILEILATDQNLKADIESWVETTKHQYLGTIEEDGILKHYVRKASASSSAEKTHKEVIENDELEKRMKENDDLLVVDVREVVEYMFGHIPNTINIPLGEIKEKAGQFNKDEEIYLICRSGSRSDFAAQQLVNLGFTKVYNVMPGMMGWTGDIEGIK